MKRFVVLLATIAMAVFMVSNSFAGNKALKKASGVTEIKLYTNENPPRFWGYDSVGTNHAANYLGQKKSYPHASSLVVRFGMNNDIVNGDTCNIYVSHDAAIGPYAYWLHFVGMPNPRNWVDIYRSDTEGYDQYLDASHTQRVTFWIKADPKLADTYPLFFVWRSQEVNGHDAFSAIACIRGETIVRIDPYGDWNVVRFHKFSGDWQFVSIPWTFFTIPTADSVQAIIPYSWAGVQTDGKSYGPDFDPSTIRVYQLDTRIGGEPDKGNFPWPDSGTPEGTGDYGIDEMILTLNPGTGVSGVNGEKTTVPLTYELKDAYPNPFNPSTTIEYGLPVSNTVKIVVYNSMGQKVKTLVNSYQTLGTYKVTWDGTNDFGETVPSGVYFCKMTSSHFSAVKKLMLMK